MMDFPAGWGVTDGHLADYTTRMLLIGFGDFRHRNDISFSISYRYALNKHGQKSVSPFNHSSGGTYQYREIKVWRFVLGICRPAVSASSEPK